MSKAIEKKVNKQQANQAPPPAFMKQVLNQHKEDPKVEPGEERDRLLLELSQSDAWVAVKDYMNAKRSQLAQELRSKSDGAHTLEEIGFRYLALDQVNLFANQVIAFVDARAKIAKIKHERDNK